MLPGLPAEGLETGSQLLVNPWAEATTLEKRSVPLSSGPLGQFRPARMPRPQVTSEEGSGWIDGRHRPSAVVSVASCCHRQSAALRRASAAARDELAMEGSRSIQAAVMPPS